MSDSPNHENAAADNSDCKKAKGLTTHDSERGSTSANGASIATGAAAAVSEGTPHHGPTMKELLKMLNSSDNEANIMCYTASLAFKLFDNAATEEGRAENAELLESVSGHQTKDRPRETEEERSVSVAKGAIGQIGQIGQIYEALRVPPLSSAWQFPIFCLYMLQRSRGPEDRNWVPGAEYYGRDDSPAVSNIGSATDDDNNEHSLEE